MLSDDSRLPLAGWPRRALDFPTSADVRQCLPCRDAERSPAVSARKMTAVAQRHFIVAAVADPKCVLFRAAPMLPSQFTVRQLFCRFEYRHDIAVAVAVRRCCCSCRRPNRSSRVGAVAGLRMVVAVPMSLWLPLPRST